MDHANAIRLACIPPSRWLQSKRAIPLVPIPVPTPEVRLYRALHLHSDLDCHDSRWRICGQLSHYQWRSVPHNAPPVLQLQLRPIHNPVGPSWWQLQEAERRVVQERREDERVGVETTNERDGEDGD